MIAEAVHNHFEGLEEEDVMVELCINGLKKVDEIMAML
jgi:hypothetical protein